MSPPWFSSRRVVPPTYAAAAATPPGLPPRTHQAPPRTNNNNNNPTGLNPQARNYVPPNPTSTATGSQADLNPEATAYVPSYTQTTIPTTKKSNDPFGDLFIIKDPAHFRFAFQNLNGIRAKNDYSDLSELSGYIKANDIDCFGGAETCLDWQRPSVSNLM
jgi:hypothetical protein